MRKLGRVSLVIIVPCALVAMSNVPTYWLLDYWWAIPLVISMASLLLLTANSILELKSGGKVPPRALSSAYALCAPSMALLGLSYSLGLSMPFWLVYTPPILLPVSAWAYYVSLGSGEEDYADIR